jgi:hypothetical protein
MSKTEIISTLQNPSRIKQAAKALVHGFVHGRRVFSGAEGVQKTAAAKPQLLSQAEDIVRHELALRAAILPA